MSDIAPLNGTTSLYTYLPCGNVLVQKMNYRHIVIHASTFNHLYYEIDGAKAALKEDCIEYCRYYPEKHIDDYPKWFKEAMTDGYIEEVYRGHQIMPGSHIYFEEGGEVLMSPGAYILRNYMGDLRYMEEYDFKKYYDIGGI